MCINVAHLQSLWVHLSVLTPYSTDCSLPMAQLVPLFPAHSPNAASWLFVCTSSKAIVALLQLCCSSNMAYFVPRTLSAAHPMSEKRAMSTLDSAAYSLLFDSTKSLVCLTSVAMHCASLFMCTLFRIRHLNGSHPKECLSLPDKLTSPLQAHSL